MGINMVYMFLADGFEEIEALCPLDLLRRAGVGIKTVSVGDGDFVTGSHGISVKADMKESDFGDERPEMVILPGGLPGADYLNEHEGLAKHIACFAKDEGKKLAAICAAPQVFGTCGILDGKKATIYPSMEECLKGGQATGKNVTVDGNIITGMGPALAMEFALKLVEEIKGKEAAEEVAAGLLFDRR